MSFKTKKGRIILIDGICGAGKSTTAQKLKHQFALHSLPHRWMHEEIAEHPIRDKEFTMGDTKTLDGMAVNVREMLERWQTLVNTAVASGETYILEGCFIHAIDRYFAKSAFTIEQTLDYFTRVSEILTEADTLFVYLRSPDVKATLEHVYTIRGQWWKDLILTPNEKFFHISEYKSDKTIYESLDLYQEISDKVFNTYSGNKLLIDSSIGSWTGHPCKILNHIGLPYIETPTFEIQEPEKFCGKYCAVNNAKQKIGIIYDKNSKVLFAEGFWPYMKLVPIAYNAFEMESFPITLTFSILENKKVVTVTGEYDWDIVGQTLTETWI